MDLIVEGRLRFYNFNLLSLGKEFELSNIDNDLMELGLKSGKL